MRVVRVLLFYLCLGKTKLLPHSTEERQQGNVKKLKACMRHFLKDSFWSSDKYWYFCIQIQDTRISLLKKKAKEKVCSWSR